MNRNAVLNTRVTMWQQGCYLSPGQHETLNHAEAKGDLLPRACARDYIAEFL